MDEAGVVQKFGVPPASIPDYLALVGDSADGYPGLKGWGAKSSAAVLAKFHHLESIPADSKDWFVNATNAGALAATLVREREQALLFRTLATLRTDIPLFENVDGALERDRRRSSIRWRRSWMRRGPRSRVTGDASQGSGVRCRGLGVQHPARRRTKSWSRSYRDLDRKVAGAGRCAAPLRRRGRTWSRDKC
jgi:5'-3' exonuclease